MLFMDEGLQRVERVLVDGIAYWGESRPKRGLALIWAPMSSIRSLPGGCSCRPRGHSNAEWDTNSASRLSLE